MRTGFKGNVHSGTCKWHSCAIDCSNFRVRVSGPLMPTRAEHSLFPTNNATYARIGVCCEKPFFSEPNSGCHTLVIVDTEHLNSRLLIVQQGKLIACFLGCRLSFQPVDHLAKLVDVFKTAVYRREA